MSPPGFLCHCFYETVVFLSVLRRAEEDDEPMLKHKRYKVSKVRNHRPVSLGLLAALELCETSAE